MEPILSAPCTPAQRQRDVLLGALVGLARSTVNEPKTEDTDHVLAAGLRRRRCRGSIGPDDPDRGDRKAPRGPQLRHLHDALRQHR